MLTNIYTQTSYQSQTQYLSKQLQHYTQLLPLAFPNLQHILTRLATDNCFLELQYSQEIPSDIYRSDSTKEDALNDPSQWIPDCNPFLCLEEILKQQLLLQHLSKCDYQIGLFIILNLDSSGYFHMPLETASHLLHTDSSHVLDILKIIQTFYPLGVAARSLAECLILQISSDFIYKNEAIALLESGTKLIESHKVKEICSIYHLSQQKFTAIMNYFRTLNPFPCTSYLPKEKALYIIPDIEIHSDHEIKIAGAQGDLLTLNMPLLSSLQSCSDEKDSKYIKKMYQQARELISILDLRSKTLYHLALLICENQKDFFLHGISELHPLSSLEAAAALNLSQTTINRCISNKYISTPHGVFPLSTFFKNGLSQSSSPTSELSTSAIKKQLYDIIMNEPANKPFSDQELSNLFQQKGICISRRTIAKYRSLLNIDTAHYRRKTK